MRVENVKGAVWTVDEIEFYKRRPQRCSGGSGSSSGNNLNAAAVSNNSQNSSNSNGNGGNSVPTGNLLAQNFSRQIADTNPNYAKASMAATIGAASVFQSNQKASTALSSAVAAAAALHLKTAGGGYHPLNQHHTSSSTGYVFHIKFSIDFIHTILSDIEPIH